jgi:hypothetical protein
VCVNASTRLPSPSTPSRFRSEESRPGLEGDEYGGYDDVPNLNVSVVLAQGRVSSTRQPACRSRGIDHRPALFPSCLSDHDVVVGNLGPLGVGHTSTSGVSKRVF